MTSSPSHRRRIDRVLDPAYVEDVSGISVEDLRSRLAAAREEEEDYSYYRKMLHARIDLLRSREGSSEDPEASPAPPPPRRGARSRLAPKAINSPGRRDVERLLSEPHLAKVDELGPQELREALVRLEEWEGKVSATRRALHRVIDSLESELAARYRDGLEPSTDRLQ